MIQVIKLLGGVRATVFAGLLLVAGAFAAIQSVRLNHAQDEIADMETAVLESEVAHQQALRKAERDSAEAIAALDQKYQKERDEAKSTTDRLLADVRSGALKLRDKFSCPIRVPGVGSAPGTSAGEEGAILSAEDQEFLVRIGEEADDAIRERNEAVRIAEEDRRILKDMKHD